LLHSGSFGVIDTLLGVPPGGVIWFKLFCFIELLFLIVVNSSIYKGYG
jgi:hypothetical protein